MRGFLRAFLLIIFGVFLPLSSYAQLSISTPATNTTLKPCDDYASLVLGNPFDMSDVADVNYFIGSDIGLLTSMQFNNGIFSATTTGPGAYFYLTSPKIQDSVASGGRYGENFPINTSKYTQFVVRMFMSIYDSGGFRLLWNRGDNYASNRTITGFNTTHTGWGTYRVNLNAVTIAGDSSNTNPWSSGSITGFSLLPHAASGAGFAIDYIRLEDTSSCASTGINYNATASGGANFFNLYLDDDSNPLNGYHTALVTAGSASGAGSTTASTNGLAVGNYKVNGFLSGDYSVLNRHEAWDMSNSDDILIVGGVSGGTFSGGSYSGTTNSAASAIYLRIPSDAINTAQYKKLSFKLTRTGYNGLMQIIGDGGFVNIDPNTYGVGGDVYQIDLSGLGWWTGTTTNLIIRPAVASSIPFSLDWVSLQSNNLINSESSLVPTFVTAPGDILVNSPPLLDILKPDKRGGEGIRPWNMNEGDFVIYENLRTDDDPNYPGEKYSSFLPDVRSIDGLRGDFFKGTNKLGIDHSVNYSSYPYFNESPLVINANSYKHLCVKLLNDRELSVCLGAIVRPYWLNANEQFTTALAAVTIYDFWSNSRWYEYCFDLPNITLNYSDEEIWQGNKIGFRVDPNEYYKDTCGSNGAPTGNGTSTTYYWDYIKLKKDYQSDDQFAIVYKLTDSEDNASVNFFYNQTKSTSGGTQINGAALNESDNTRVLLWNTSALAAGTYYIYGVATDGYSTMTKLADNPVVVSHGTPAVETPVLTLESPTEGQTVCSSLQVKGYSLMAGRYEDVASVEVLLDGILLGTIQPDVYSPNAKIAYPNADSSNSGFNTTYDISGYSSGSHTLSLRSYSTDGELTTVSRAITKGNSDCPGVVSDPEPAGTPVIIPGNLETSFEIRKPTISKVKLTAKGVFTIKVNKATNEDLDCRIRLEFGTNNKKFSNLTAGLNVVNPTVNLNAKKTGVPSVSKLYVRVRKTCLNDYGVSEFALSLSKGVKIPKASNKISLSSFVSKIKTSLVVQ